MKNPMFTKPWLMRLEGANLEGGSGEPKQDQDTANHTDAGADSGEGGAGQIAEGEEEPEDAWDQERALAKIKKINAENRNLRERSKKAEAKAATLEEALKENEMLKASILKNRVAAKYQIPVELADRLQGETEEELTQDAENLLQLFQPKVGGGRPRNMLGEGHKPIDDEPIKDLDKLAASFMG